MNSKIYGIILGTMVLLLAGCGSNTKQQITENNTQQVQAVETIAKDCNMLHFIDARGNEYDVAIQPGWAKNNYEKTAFIHDSDKLIYENNTEYTYRLGIDVSKYQTQVDWDKVKADGYEFVFVRIGYRGYGESGKLCEDEKAIEHIKGALAAGLDVGVYFFSQAINEKEAKEEAEYAMQILSKNGLTNEDIVLPIVFDPESILDDDARTDSVTGEQFTKNTVEFCKTVESAGYKSMIYCNMLWEATMLNLGELQDIPVWYADYENQPQTPYQFEFWQYSEAANVDGIADGVDVNIQLIHK